MGPVLHSTSVLFQSALPVLLLAAFFAGFVDAIAGGGGLLTMPVLLAVGLPHPIALGTNKGQAVFGAVTSVTSFARKGAINRERAPLSFLFAFVGSLIGAWFMLRMKPDLLKPIVFFLLIAAAVLSVVPRDRLPKVVTRALWVPPFIALILGAYDGFFGPGAGSMLIILYVMFLGDTMTEASANAKVANFASNLAAFLTFAIRGTIIWKIALPMAAVNMCGAALGARVAWRGGDKLIRWILLAIVTALVIKLGFDLTRPPAPLQVDATH